jgi:hypothetical protein
MKINITEKTVNYFAQETGLDIETTEELLQIVLTMCMEDSRASEAEPIEYVDYLRVDRANKEEREGKGSELEKAAREAARIYKSIIRSGPDNTTPHLMISLLARLGDSLRKIEEILGGGGKPELVSREEVDSILWDVHKALTRHGFYPNKYKTYSEAIDALAERSREGEGSEDKLYKTARALLDYYRLTGPSEFRSRFGSLDILEPARKIVEEGEGNPHPWP